MSIKKFSTYDKEIKYYKINKNTILYRGNNNQYINNLNLKDTYEYFGLNIEIAKKYGLVKIYKTNCDLFLYAMDEPENIKKIYIISSNDMKDKIEFAFGFPNNLIRYSIKEIDYEIINNLCILGYDGYACDEMIDYFDQIFHGECSICDPNKKVIFIEKYIDYDVNTESNLCNITILEGLFELYKKGEFNFIYDEKALDNINNQINNEYHIEILNWWHNNKLLIFKYKENINNAIKNNNKEILSWWINTYRGKIIFDIDYTKKILDENKNIDIEFKELLIKLIKLSS